MKYIYTLFSFFALNICLAKAQVVYNTVLDNATRVINSPTSGYTQAQIAKFK